MGLDYPGLPWITLDLPSAGEGPSCLRTFSPGVNRVDRLKAELRRRDGQSSAFTRFPTERAPPAEEGDRLKAEL